MMKFLRQILMARGIAAIIGVVTSVVAVYLLPGPEYAVASLATAFSAVGTTMLYQPFSKYVLISRDPDVVESLFWKVQPLAILVMAGISLLSWSLASEGTASLAIAAGVFAISQGWKDFNGEVLRVRRRAGRLGQLYILDASSTLLLTIGFLFFVQRAEVLLLASAISSLVWSRWSSDSRIQSEQTPGMKKLTEIYRYSFGVVGSGSLNAGAVALARAAVLKNSPPGMAGAIQFLLDMLQKAMALYSSSIVSAAVPEAKERGVNGMLRNLGFLMLLAILMLLAAATAIASFYSQGIAPNGSVAGKIPIAIAMASALLIWSTRLKATFFDLPLLCSVRHVWLLLAGSGSTLVAMVLVNATKLDTLSTLLWCSLAMIAGGIVSCCIGTSIGSCSRKFMVASTVLAASVFACVALAARVIDGTLG